MPRACPHKNPPRDLLGRCTYCWPGGVTGKEFKERYADVEFVLPPRMAFGRDTGPEYMRKQRERNRPMMDRLRNLQIERMDLDDAVALAAFGRSVEAEYGHVSAEAPDWLTTNMKELRKEIRSRLQDTLERRLSEAKSKLAALATTEEKRDQLRKEIEALSGKLGSGAGA